MRIGAPTARELSCFPCHIYLFGFSEYDPPWMLGTDLTFPLVQPFFPGTAFTFFSSRSVSLPPRVISNYREILNHSDNIENRRGSSCNYCEGGARQRPG